jgi:AraC-like DNA-binding protein
MRTDKLPLASFEVFRTHDLTEAAASAGHLLSPHRVTAIGRHSKADVRYHCITLNDVALIYARYGAAVRIDPGALENFYLIGMPITGTGWIMCDGSEIVSNSRIASVQSYQRPVLSQWSANCQKITVKIGRAALERHLNALLGVAAREPLEFDLAFDLRRPGGASWQNLIKFLLSEIVPGSLSLSVPQLQRSLEECVMTTLLFAHHSNYSDALLSDIRPTEPACLKRVEDIIAADPARNFSIHELATLGGSSIRGLQAGFRKHRGLTLTEFIRALRLDNARSALLQGGGHENVTSIALRSGYGHLGRFARDYKARFGESPSRTLSRGRSLGR